MHTALTGGYKGLTGDAANIKQGDDFLAQVIPVIMASKAYKENGVIILWWDESESDGVKGDNADDFSHTIAEIVISKHAHQNDRGVPYASPVEYSHSSDLKTMQEVFQMGPLLGDAQNANPPADLFQPGAIKEMPVSSHHPPYCFPLRNRARISTVAQESQLFCFQSTNITPGPLAHLPANWTCRPLTAPARASPLPIAV